VPKRQPRRLSSLFGTRVQRERRPQGVSRKRRKQLGFESLEARQVMSATSPLAQLNMTGVVAPTVQVQSISSSTPEGALEAYARELYWQSLIAASHGMTTAETNSIPTDPLLGDQWHLINSGQSVGNPDYQSIFGKPGEDINVAPVWNVGIDGRGIVVAVIDSGVQLDHPDLAANIDRELALDALNPNGDGNPDFRNPGSFHGTAVAGLLGAVANNGIGGTGVSPGVTIVPIRLIDPFDPAAGNPAATSIAFAHTIGNVDITNNSWGPGAPFRTLSAFSAFELSILRDSIVFGRDGKGIIHVFSSGNSAGNTFNAGFTDPGVFDSSSYGLTNSRYLITVGGVDHDGSYNNADGTVTNYPEAGANVLVVAPTGSFARIDIGDDTGIGSGIVTTDLTGDFGANAGPDPIFGIDFDRDYLDDTDYTSRMNGTSASAPIATAAVALMLQANPELTWRDVQEILVRSARQNSPLEVPSIGADVQTQNTWIVNQVPVFHDPDIWLNNIPIDPSLRTLAPTLDPNAFFVIFGGLTGRLGPDHYAPTPFQMTNGAGYTVSQGIGVYGEQIGYGHGVVDAEMAVALAQQWHTKNQALPSELTFTSFVAHPGDPLRLPPMERGSMASGFQAVPGGIGGTSGFISYWNEFFVANPDFTQDFPYRGDSYVEFEVPDSNAMSIESVDVRIAITGDAQQALEHLRITLISPDGTHSELNHYIVDDPGAPRTFQWLGLTEAHPYIGSFGTTDPNTAPLVWTFNSNRHWGERSDNRIVFDPVTGEPFVDETGFFTGSVNQPGVSGQALTQGWRVVIENWDANDTFGLADVELAWHGTPVAANSERVQGFVGIDEDGDDSFNYSRVIQQIVEFDNDPTVMRLGEVINTIDQTQEAFAGNVTVKVRRVSDNALVDQFVTGADGNFYFDLVPDDYIISIEDPLGRLAKQDELTPDGLLRHYQTEWRITPEHFNVWDHMAGNPNEVVVDAEGVPIPWLDGNLNEQAYGMKGINFLLEGDPQPQQATFTGTVYADVNGDGVFNNGDTLLPNVSVFADVNRNGAPDGGETVVLTNANGQYTLVTPLTAPAAVMNVGVVPPSSWTATNPASGLHGVFVTPGTSISGLDFFVKPGADNSGGGGAEVPGLLMGVVYNDLDGDGVRDANEVGEPQIDVYIDANNNGVNDVGDTSTTTNQFGAYLFTNVAPGAHVIRVDVVSPFAVTQPASGAHSVNLVGSSTISNLNFGIFDTALFDFGDLPDVYATLQGSNGARHRKGEYWLGAKIDSELNGQPSADANGDNALDQPDEDGIVVSPIFVNSTATVTATPSRHGGYLQGWIDWNNDGDFNDAGERVITNHLLTPSQPALNTVSFAVPAGVTSANVYARFRYGEFANGGNAIGTPVGPALIGEVEDYLLPVENSVPPQNIVETPDFDGDDDVDGSDFLTWQRNLGASNAYRPQGDATGDNKVNNVDLSRWYLQFGETDMSATGSTSLAAASGQSSQPLAEGSAARALTTLSGGLRGGVGRSVSEMIASPERGTATRPGFRPGQSNRSGELSGVADRMRQLVQGDESRLGEVRNFIGQGLVVAGERVPSFDGELARVDRALDDLFSPRRREELRAELEAELASGEDEADAAFAALADEFVWPL